MSNEIDMLASLESLDLTNVQTGMPVLPVGLYEVTVKDIKTVENNKKTGHNFKIELGLTQPATSIDGKVVNPGFPIFTIISLVKTEKYDPTQTLAAFKECFTGTKAGGVLPTSQFFGAVGSVRLSVETSEEYGTQNRVARYIKKA